MARHSSVSMPPMLRRLLALAGALAIASAGVTPCAAAAIARGPAGADAHAAHHASATAVGAEGAASQAEHAAECHEPGASLVPHCSCGCTADRPHGVASSAPPTFGLSEEPAPEPARALRAEPLAAPAPRAEAPRPRIDHVPIAS